MFQLLLLESKARLIQWYRTTVLCLQVLEARRDTFICSIDLRPSLGRVEQLVMICMVERRSHLEACSLTCQLLGWRNSSLASPGTTDQKVFLASAYGRRGLLLTRVPREFRTPKSVLWGVRWKMWGLLWPNSEVTWCHFCHTRLVKAVISPPRCQERNIDPISQLKMCQNFSSYFFKNCLRVQLHFNNQGSGVNAHNWLSWATHLKREILVRYVRCDLLNYLLIFIFYFLVGLCSMWDFSYLTKDWTCILRIGSMES